MQVKNGELNVYIEFLDVMKLKGKSSLGRTKLIEAFRTHLKEFGEDQINIIEEFDAWTDKEKGTYKNDNRELNEAMQELLIQDIEIEFKSPFKKDLTEALEDYDEELSGVNAEVYAKIYETLIKEGEN